MSTAYFSSAAMDWRTPRELFDPLLAEFGFTIDVCSSDDNALLTRHWTEVDEALLRSWAGERVWMNPPFGRQIKRWMEKAWTESVSAEVIVALVPSRTDTFWWHEYAMKADEIRFLRKRLRFGSVSVSGRDTAPFPSSLCIFRGTPSEDT
jgi:site-specific DNA-methyltransferase (adenine-specific)